MNDIDGGGCLAILGVIVLFLLVAASIGKKVEETHWKTECVKRGVAEWKVEDNGDTRFVWLMNTKAQNE